MDIFRYTCNNLNVTFFFFIFDFSTFYASFFSLISTRLSPRVNDLHLTCIDSFFFFYERDGIGMLQVSSSETHKTLANIQQVPNDRRTRMELVLTNDSVDTSR